MLTLYNNTTLREEIAWQAEPLDNIMNNDDETCKSQRRTFSKYIHSGINLGARSLRSQKTFCRVRPEVHFVSASPLAIDLFLVTWYMRRILSAHGDVSFAPGPRSRKVK